MRLFMIEVPVSDLERSLSWYVEALRLEVLMHDPVGGFALLEGGGARLALKRRAGAPPGRQAIRIVFEVDDVDAERGRLLGLGAEVGAPIEDPAEGYREVRLGDPDGTPIGLFSWTRAGDRPGSSPGPGAS